MRLIIGIFAVLFSVTILVGENIGAQPDTPDPTPNMGGLRGIEIPPTLTPTPAAITPTDPDNSLLRPDRPFEPFTLISATVTDKQSDAKILAFTWTPLNHKTRWYQVRVVNAKGKVLLSQQFDEIDAICVDGLCSVQITDTENALKEDKRYRWHVVAKVRGEKALVRTPKRRLSLQNPAFDGVMALPSREIAFTNFAANQVHVKDTAGSNVTNFPQGGTLPIWSLTGGELAYINASAQIALYDFRTETGSTVGGSANAVIPQIKDTYWDPVWSPDGSKIAFVLSSDLAASSDRVDIFVMDADGNNIQNLTAGLTTVVHVLPSWSPDGTQLAISASASGNDFDIFIINAATGSLVATVTDDNFPDGAPFWSVNGNKLAFLSPTNPDCLPFCVANADGSDVDTFNPLPPPAGNGDPLDWGAVWLPNGDYAFARLVATPSVSSALYLNSSGSDQLLFNDAWFPKWRPSPSETLLVYGIEVVDVALWETSSYLPDLGPGVEVVARALSSLNTAYEFSEPPHVIFRRVLTTGVENNRIAFALSSSESNCVVDFDINLYVRLITCSSLPSAPFTEYTAAHELGHALVSRTGGQKISDPNGLYGLVNLPQRVGLYSTIRADNRRVFGTFTWSIADPVDPNNLAEFPDWERGNRGWGSGAVSYADPKWSERIGQGFLLPPPDFVWLGPCGSAVTEFPTDFQQNPCYLKNWVVINRTAYTSIPAQLEDLTVEEIDKLGGIEIEETAADMFLNWSYRTLNLGGFENVAWVNKTESVPNPSGDVRFDWMNCAMVVIFNQYQFWQSGSVAVPGDCTTRYGL